MHTPLRRAATLLKSPVAQAAQIPDKHAVRQRNFPGTQYAAQQTPGNPAAIISRDAASGGVLTAQ
jgi:hypothetical protein